MHSTLLDIIQNRGACITGLAGQGTGYAELGLDFLIRVKYRNVLLIFFFFVYTKVLDDEVIPHILGWVKEFHITAVILF